MKKNVRRKCSKKKDKWTVLYICMLELRVVIVTNNSDKHLHTYFS